MKECKGWFQSNINYFIKSILKILKKYNLKFINNDYCEKESYFWNSCSWKNSANSISYIFGVSNEKYSGDDLTNRIIFSKIMWRRYSIRKWLWHPFMYVNELSGNHYLKLKTRLQHLKVKLHTRYYRNWTRHIEKTGKQRWSENLLSFL